MAEFAPMGTHSVAEAKNRLSDLIDRALAGEDVTITRHGRPVVELRPVEQEPGPVRPEDIDWLAARVVGSGPAPACDAGRLVSEMRDEDEER
jgi:prevent-host-death family protein